MNGDPNAMISPSETPNRSMLPSNADNQHNHSDLFGGAGHGTDIHHTAKPAITSHALVTNKAPTAFPGVTDPHMMDSFHTHGPHDLLHGHMHPDPNPALHDNLHNIPHIHDISHHDIGKTQPKLQTKSTTAKLRATTAAPVPTKVVTEKRNLIVGDWSGAEQSLSGPPPRPPPSRDLALEHPHGHHHFDSHVHGFTEPSIPPPPPPTAEMTPSVHPVNVQPASQSPDKQQAKQPFGIHPVGQQEIQPSSQLLDIHPSNQPVDIHQVGQQEIQPSSQLLDIHPPNQPVDIHQTSLLDNILPTNASTASENIVLSPPSSANIKATAGMKDSSGISSNLLDPNIGHSIHSPIQLINDPGHLSHDLGHLVNDPGNLVHQAGHSAHDQGHNLSAGNLLDLNNNFMNVLDTNLNQHIGKYKSALVYLYDPLNGTLNQANGLDIVEIALNLTDLPLHSHASPLNHEKQTQKTQNENTNLVTSKPILSELRKVSHLNDAVVSALQINYNMSTPANLKQTQIDSNNLHGIENQILKPTTPSLLVFESAAVSNRSNNVSGEFTNQTIVNQNVTRVPLEVGGNMSMVSSNHSSSANHTIAAHVTAPTTNSTLFSMDFTTAIGSTTLDPDYLADLAEAQEEAAQLAAELAEAGGMTTKSMTTDMSTGSATAKTTTTHGATANSMIASSATANKKLHRPT